VGAIVGAVGRYHRARGCVGGCMDEDVGAVDVGAVDVGAVDVGAVDVGSWWGCLAGRSFHH
jgi:hypothetical protein